MRQTLSEQQLPAVAAVPALSAALAAQRAAVLVADPGSGKTTGVPLLLQDAPWLGGQRILMLEPRRLAARAAAARMAWLLGEPVGQTVGYAIRGERRCGPRTRIEVVTEGLLTRRLQSDPDLPGVGLVIFDEFHERSLHADLALALTLDARRLLRPELRVLVMSATLEAEQIAALLGGAPVVRAPGRRHPVEVRHRPGGGVRDLADAVVAGVREALQAVPAEPGSDILAFVPGRAEIEVVCRAFGGRAGLAVHRLHSGLPTAAQDAALVPDPQGRRKLVVATNVAQTSLTVDGVSVVVDSGFVRRARFDPGAGADRLHTERISRATAEQRAGRAGRQRPGLALRMWSREQHGRLPDHDPPEIAHADLSRLALDVLVWGTPPDALPLPSPPPETAWRIACETLRALGALDDDGRVTALGRALADLPLPPRLAALMHAAAAEGQGATGAAICALLDGGAPSSGDLAAQLARPLRADVAADARRLMRIVGARGAPDPARAGPLLARAYPERIARLADARSRSYATAGGTRAVLPADFGTLPEFLAIAEWAPGGEHRIRSACALDAAVFGGPLADLVAVRSGAVWDAQRERVVGLHGRYVGRLALEQREVDPGDGPGAEILAEQLARRGAAALAADEAVRQLCARLRSLRHWDPDGGWPDLDLDRLAARAAEWLPAWAAGMRSMADLRRLDLHAVIAAELGQARMRHLDELAPTALRVPSGATRPLHYAGDGSPPLLQVRLQEMLGATDTPRVCAGRVPVVVELLSPAMRPIQRTSDLAGFWRGSYAEVRRQMRARYPKHHWPENPAESAPLRGTMRRQGRTP